MLPQSQRDQIRYNLGEIEYLNREAAHDAMNDEELVDDLTDEERRELEEEYAREFDQAA